MVGQLEAHFGTLPKMLFFEHPTIDALCIYFEDQHREALSAWLIPGATKASVALAQ